MNARLKKGDNVKVLSGKDRGKTGKVVSVDPKASRVTVEGINLLTRHQRPKKSGKKGQKVRLPAPLAVSRLMIICPHCNKPTRIGSHVNDKGVKLRSCKKCGKDI